MILPTGSSRPLMQEIKRSQSRETWWSIWTPTSRKLLRTRLMFHVSKKSTLFPRKYFKYSEERQWCQYDEIRIKKTKNKGPDRGREGGQRYRAEAARSLALSGCCPQAKNRDARREGQDWLLRDWSSHPDDEQWVGEVDRRGHVRGSWQPGRLGIRVLN